MDFFSKSSTSNSISFSTFTSASFTLSSAKLLVTTSSILSSSEISVTTSLIFSIFFISSFDFFSKEDFFETTIVQGLEKRPKIPDFPSVSTSIFILSLVVPSLRIASLMASS